MKESRVRRRLLLKKLDATVTDPAPYLSGDKSREHDKEPSSYLFPEDGHCQTCFGNGKPGPLGELLDLDGPQRAEA